MADNRPLPPTPAFAGSPWLVIPNCLPPEFLTEVIDYAEQFAEKEVGRVGQALGQTDQTDKSHREDIRACDISGYIRFKMNVVWQSINKSVVS